MENCSYCAFLKILPHRRGWNFLGTPQSSVRPKQLKKCMKLNWNFQRGWWVFSSGGIMDIFWHYAFEIFQIKLGIFVWFKEYSYLCH